jgi:Spy/CpxP family protein refolding chaperone
MVRQLAWTLGVVFLLAPAAQAVACAQDQAAPAAGARASQPPPRPKFWMDPALRKELGITDQQSKAIEDIFESTVPSLRAARKEMEQLEDDLSKTIHANVADVATVARQIDKVEAARSAYNKARTLMLYRVNLVLSADQRERVRAMFERDQARGRDDDRRRQDREPRR